MKECNIPIAMFTLSASIRDQHDVITIVKQIDVQLVSNYVNTN